MKEIQDEHLNFVARHFEPGALRTREAWRRVKKRLTSTRFNYGYILAVSAVAAALAIGVFLFNSDSHSSTTVSAGTVARTVILPDNTTAVLAPESSVSFHQKRFAHKNRDVRMTGKVYFDVSRREDLSFRIEASDALVTVLGTHFQVTVTEDATLVDVVEGKVSLAASSALSEGLVLTDGMHAELLRGAPAPSVVSAGYLNPAAWATHRFIYNDTPLEDVLEDLGACFGCKLTCDAIGRRLTGEFRADTVREAVTVVEDALGVKIDLL